MVLNAMGKLKSPISQKYLVGGWEQIIGGGHQVSVAMVTALQTSLFLVNMLALNMHTSQEVIAQ